MSNIHFVDATTPEHCQTMSLLHALGWRTTYADAVPPDYMAREITDDRWVDYFQESFAAGKAHGLILCADGQPVSCATYGPARTDSGKQGDTVCKLESQGFEGWGEVISFYNHPDQTGKGYGSLLMEEVLGRLRGAGYRGAIVYVLRENDKARSFYARHGFSWDGGQVDLPFPPDMVCTDLRYTQSF